MVVCEECSGTDNVSRLCGSCVEEYLRQRLTDPATVERVALALSEARQRYGWSPAKLARAALAAIREVR